MGQVMFSWTLDCFLSKGGLSGAVQLDASLNCICAVYRSWYSVGVLDLSRYEDTSDPNSEFHLSTPIPDSECSLQDGNVKFRRARGHWLGSE